MVLRGAIAVLGVVVVLVLAVGPADAVPPAAPQLREGEYLQYKVKWWIFRLGTIGVVTDAVQDSTGTVTYMTSVSLESNPALFFVNVHSRYESRIAVSPIRCIEFTGWEYKSPDTVTTRYRLIDSLRQIRMEQWNTAHDTLLRQGVVDSIEVFYEGASLFFLARSLLHSGLKISVPVIVDMEFFPVDIQFTSTIVPEEIEALEYPVATKELSGRAHFVGKSLAGFSGGFRGWFSNDEAAIPLRAEMNLSLGTAEVILEHWQRSGWSPPEYRR